VTPRRGQLVAAYLLIFVAALAVGAAIGWTVWAAFGR
jgi:hypothetical protein